MSHVEIKKVDGHPPVLLVDGVNLSNSVLADGFKIEFADDRDRFAAYVHMTVAAEVLDADLPDSVLVAIREGGAIA